MSGGKACECDERHEPLAGAPGNNRPGRLWRVSQRRCNHSAFNGYNWTPSRYSAVRCIRCGAVWRTASDYVDHLPDEAEEERFVSVGHEGHRAAMERFGREVHPHQPSETEWAEEERR